MLRKGLAMVLDSLGAFLESGVEAIQSRFQDESRRLFQLILCAGALVVVGTIGLVLLALTVVSALLEAGFMQALGVTAGIYLSGAVWIYRRMNKALMNRRPPFERTVERVQEGP